mmetsp:Transcript_41597/g.63474  ORF Transcript_41597/g.63474 Transcript_41597/m.63474 type:complete len:255 (+) Transcript_41597:414-1178(+)
MKALKVSCGSHHSLILFENQAGKQVLFSVGNSRGSDYQHLSQEEEVTQNEEIFHREIPLFSDRTIVDFSSGDLASMVVLDGSCDIDKNLYSHKLPDGRTVSGLLHFFKKDGQWTYVSEEEVASGKATLPDLCLAIRCPIEDIPSLQWPDLDALAAEVLDSSAEEVVHSFTVGDQDKTIKGPLYYSKYLINSQEIEVYKRMEDKEDEDNINPQVFFRLAKPLKKGAKLPIIDLTKYYKQGSKHGIEIEIQPDLSL